MKISGKIIVITGASSGIGKRLKEYFQRENTVISLSRTAKSPDIECDLCDENAIDCAANRIIEKFGKVDMLINKFSYKIAGTFSKKPISYQNTLLITWITFLVLLIAGNILFNIFLVDLCYRIPF